MEKLFLTILCIIICIGWGYLCGVIFKSRAFVMVVGMTGGFLIGTVFVPMILK